MSAGALIARPARALPASPARILDWKSLTFAGFLSAGHFKLDPRLSWLTWDLTLLMAGLSVLLAVYSLARARFRVAAEMKWVLVLYASLALCLFWTPWTPYAVHKVARLYILTFLATSLPLLLFRTPADVQRFIAALSVLGILLAADGAVTLLTERGLHRLSGGGATTGAFGQAVGTSALWLTVLALERKAKLPGAFLLTGALVTLVFASGSRGPLLGLMLATLSAGALFYLRRFQTLMRFALVVAVTVFFLTAGLSIAPDWSVYRVSRFFQGEWGLSEQARIEAYTIAVSEISRHPMGIGWGGFADLHFLLYPHNLLLELCVESGIIGGIVFMGLLGVAMRRAYRLSRETGEMGPRLLWILLLFWATTAMVSGDINDARPLLALISLGLACPGIWLRSGITRSDLGVTR